MKSQNPSITDDEEALYEFLEEADIYATLVLVFDSLNDTSRRITFYLYLMQKEYIQKLQIATFFYAIKNNHLDMVDDIISNANNVDVKAALSEILTKYPDGKERTKYKSPV